MVDSILYMLKRFWYLIVFIFVVSIPLVVLGGFRTDKALILKGGASVFEDVVTINTDYKVSGSFSTLFVISMEHSTILQNIITNNDPTIESYTISKATADVGDIDGWKASKIQYDSSIQNSLIVAYKEAMKENSNINIIYEFKGFDITNYGVNSKFRIADRVIKIKSQHFNGEEILAKDEMKFREAINHQYVNDVYTILRNNNVMEIVLSSEDSFGASSIYEIDNEKTTPSFNIKNIMVGGPSGGLLQTLSIYDRLTGKDLTKGRKIAGTGTIAYNGRVGAIGGIKEKVPTAIDNHIDVFFCPSVNYDDALVSYNSLPNSKKMKLVKIDTFYDALNYLKGEEI